MLKFYIIIITKQFVSLFWQAVGLPETLADTVACWIHEKASEVGRFNAIKQI